MHPVALQSFFLFAPNKIPFFWFGAIVCSFYHLHWYSRLNRSPKHYLLIHTCYKNNYFTSLNANEEKTTQMKWGVVFEIGANEIRPFIHAQTLGCLLLIRFHNSTELVSVVADVHETTSFGKTRAANRDLSLRHHVVNGLCRFFLNLFIMQEQLVYVKILI